MKLEVNQNAGQHQAGPDSNRSVCGGFFDLNKQVLRVLRCSAHALATSPGGLRFKAGTRPWLEGLQPTAQPLLSHGAGRYFKTALPTCVDAT